MCCAWLAFQARNWCNSAWDVVEPNNYGQEACQRKQLACQSFKSCATAVDAKIVLPSALSSQRQHFIIVIVMLMLMFMFMFMFMSSRQGRSARQLRQSRLPSCKHRHV